MQLLLPGAARPKSESRLPSSTEGLEHRDLVIRQVDGDPLRDIGVLAKDGRHLDVIMKAGRFYKRPG